VQHIPTHSENPRTPTICQRTGNKDTADQTGKSDRPDATQLFGGKRCAFAQIDSNSGQENGQEINSNRQHHHGQIARHQRP